MSNLDFEHERQLLNGPSTGTSFSEGISLCLLDLKPMYLALAETALAAGWNRAEIAIAVTKLADLSLIEKALDISDIGIGETRIPHRDRF